ncbi:MAG: hypothetical protein ABSA59_12615 [Terriglobia bacterium]|jgi:hypothetical protein
MATESYEETPMNVPFLFRFAQPMPEVPLHPLRYDNVRQISQMLIDGRWIDSHDVSVELIKATRFTRVERETSDDE